MRAAPLRALDPRAMHSVTLLMLVLLPLGMASSARPAPRVAPSPPPPPPPPMPPSPSPVPVVQPAYPFPTILPSCQWNNLYGQCELSSRAVLQQGLIIPQDGPALAFVRAVAAQVYCRTLVGAATCTASPGCEFYQASTSVPGTCRASPLALVDNACPGTPSFQYQSCQLETSPALCKANTLCKAGAVAGDCNATIVNSMTAPVKAAFLNNVAISSSTVAGCCAVSDVANALATMCLPQANGTCPYGCDASRTDYGDYAGEPLQCKVSNAILFELVWGATAVGMPAAAILTAQDLACAELSNESTGEDGNCNGAIFFPVVSPAILKAYTSTKQTGGPMTGCGF